ncbi:MAG: hypothetical protein FJ030_02745 [Chloroflexi bacterium]|nr:hypothetical protein [Chloroflexota bacterium]
MTLPIGENVGAYRIIAQLGQGGMATVYKAYHANLDRYVAIKVMHPAFKEDKSFLVRFQREARVLAKLEHPNIVPIYDFSDHNGQPYLVMKYVEGETLKGRLGQGPASLAETLKVVDAVGSALAYAHKQGILHRDVKPSNVIITADGHYYLSDFGLARIASAGESTLSQDTMLGTPNYISPEQAKGVKDLDGRTDIYSFGVVLYEMIVGRVPFSGDTPFSVIHDHIYTPMPPPTALNPNVPESLEKFLLKAMAKERDDRFADASAMVAAFHQAVGEQLPGAATHHAQMGSSTADTASMPAPVPEPTQIAPRLAAAPTVKAPPAAPTVQVKKTTAPAAEPKKPGGVNWLIIGGIMVVLALLAVGGLFVVNRLARAARATQTATAVAVQPTSLPTKPLPPTPPPQQPSSPPGATDAIARAQAAVAANPDSTDAHLELAKAYQDAGMHAEAAQEWMLAAQLDGYTIEFYRRRVALPLRDDPLTALIVIADGIRHNNTNEMWELASPPLERAAGMPGAEPVLQMYAADFPDRAIAIAALARHYLITGHPEQAKPYVDDLRARFPDNPLTHFVYGDYLAATGDIAGAIHEMEIVVADPRVPDSMRKLVQSRINELKGTPQP